MGRIADVFFRAKIDDSTLDVEAVKAGDKAGAKGGAAMSQSFSQKLKGGFKSGGAGLLDGLKLGAGIAAFSGLETAASSVVSVIGDMIDKAKADEESVNRLTASLRTNVPGWDGNTAAIEKNITSKQRLGFEDEALRNSLTVLVGATHDVTKAQEIQNIAMDLARFKGIDLQTASEALIKVEGGHYKMLAQLGIKMKANATQAEALAAVQKVASGQAEAFAATTSGKLLKAQIDISEKMEELGRRILPLVSEGLTLLNTVLDDVATGAGTVADGIGTIQSAIQPVLAALRPFIDLFVVATDAMKNASDAVGNLVNQVPLLGPALDLVGKALTLPAQPLFFLKDRFDDLTKTTAEAARTVPADAQAVADSFGSSFGYAAAHAADDIATIADTAEETATKTETAFDRMTASAEAFGKVLDAEQKTVNDYYDVIIQQDNLAQINHDINVQKKIIANAKDDKDGRATAAAATVRLHQLQKDQKDAITDLAAHGATKSKVFTTTLAKLYKTLKTAHGDEKTAIQAEIDSLLQLQYAAMRAAQALRFDQTGRPFGNPGRASGGPVAAGQSYDVGEEGRERLVLYPGGGGYVIPLSKSPQPSYAVAAMGTFAPVGGGGGDTFIVNNNVKMEGTPKALDPLGVARQLARLTELGGFGRPTNISPEARK